MCERHLRAIVYHFDNNCSPRDEFGDTRCARYTIVYHHLAI